MPLGAIGEESEDGGAVAHKDKSHIIVQVH
jgi:hypothetical protein